MSILYVYMYVFWLLQKITLPMDPATPGDSAFASPRVDPTPVPVAPSPATSEGIAERAKQVNLMLFFHFCFLYSLLFFCTESGATGPSALHLPRYATDRMAVY